jgi:hypothetical protein
MMNITREDLEMVSGDPNVRTSFNQTIRKTTQLEQNTQSLNIVEDPFDTYFHSHDQDYSVDFRRPK